MEQGDILQLFYYLADPLEASKHVLLCVNFQTHIHDLQRNLKETAGKRGHDTFRTHMNEAFVCRFVRYKTQDVCCFIILLLMRKLHRLKGKLSLFDDFLQL